MKLRTRKLRPTDRRKQERAAYHRILRKCYQQPNSAFVQRVLRMLQLMREAESRRLQLYERCKLIESDPDSCAKHEEEMTLGKFSHPELQALNAGFEDRLRKIEKAMKRYRWTPTVRASEFHGLNQTFIWPGRRDSERFWENFAVFWLLGQIRGSGMSPAPILRFRQCRRCSKWLYAVTDHQVYCSANCRQKDHADSPEFRAKRAKYMREEFRPRQKEDDRKAIEGVKRAKAT